MISNESLFQNGSLKKFSKESKLFSINDSVGDAAIFYINKGLVKLRIPRANGGELTIYLKEGDLVGVPEVFADTDRITEAVCKEDTDCYIWDKENFLLTNSIVWELSLYTIKSLSTFLKIINAEFVDKISLKI